MLWVRRAPGFVSARCKRSGLVASAAAAGCGNGQRATSKAEVRRLVISVSVSAQAPRHSWYSSMLLCWWRQRKFALCRRHFFSEFTVNLWNSFLERNVFSSQLVSMVLRSAPVTTPHESTRLRLHIARKSLLIQFFLQRPYSLSWRPVSNDSLNAKLTSHSRNAQPFTPFLERYPSGSRTGLCIHGETSYSGVPSIVDPRSSGRKVAKLA